MNKYIICGKEIKRGKPLNHSLRKKYKTCSHDCARAYNFKLTYTRAKYIAPNRRVLIQK